MTQPKELKKERVPFIWIFLTVKSVWDLSISTAQLNLQTVTQTLPVFWSYESQPWLKEEGEVNHNYVICKTGNYYYYKHYYQLACGLAILLHIWITRRYTPSNV